MTYAGMTDDELRELIALGDKATARPWGYDTSLGSVFSGDDVILVTHFYSGDDFQNADDDAAYTTTAANLAPDIARELIEARERVAKLEGIVNGFLTEFENFPEGERAIVDKAREIMKGGDV